MKNFLIALLIFLIWSVFGLWLYSLLDSNSISKVAEIETVEIPSANPSFIEPESTLPSDTATNIPTSNKSPELSKNKKAEKAIEPSGLKVVNLEGETIFLFPQGILIQENDDEIVIPNESKDFKYKINSYLIEHPEAEIHIQSFYSPNENIETPNLGIQRANKIKEILVNTGIDENYIVIKPFIKEINFDENGEYRNSLSILFKPLDTARIEDLKKTVLLSKIVYPKFTTSGIQVDNTLKELLKEIKEITEEHPELIVQLTGHTDNIGNANDNYKLGLVYSRQVRWYLVTKGKIKSSRIRAISKGESEPIDTNKSQRGREANRRIEVHFM